MRVYIRHVRQAKLCARGLHTWFIHKGWSRQQVVDFIKNGLPAEEVEAMNDPLANRVLEAARAEAASKKVTHG